MLWHKNKWSEQPSFSRNQTRTPDLSHALPLSCNHQKTSSPRYPLYGGSKSFNCTPNRYSVCAIELCYVETSIWKKCTLSSISGFDSLATTDLPLSWIFTSKHIFVPVDQNASIFFFYLRWRLSWIQILCFRWLLTMTSGESRYIYSVFLTAAQDKHMYSAKPAQKMHNTSLMCMYVGS